ncbi:hypothetical protein [Anaerosporobacter sp.]
MVREEILKSSNELVNQIYEKMRVIESCDAITDKIKDLDVCFNDNEQSIVSLEGVLSVDQLTGIRGNILDVINNNAVEAQKFLEQMNLLSMKPATINPESEQATKVKPEPKVLDVKEVREYYKDYTIKECCEYFHVSTVKMGQFIKDNNLAKTKAKAEPVKQPIDANEIRELYITKNQDLADIAHEKGYTKKELFDFCKANNIVRPKTPSGDWR